VQSRGNPGERVYGRLLPVAHRARQCSPGASGGASGRV